MGKSIQLTLNNLFNWHLIIYSIDTFFFPNSLLILENLYINHEDIQRIEQLQGEVNESEELYDRYIQELANEAIPPELN